MSISAAFASAVSGLTANARQAAVLSSNVVNATTPGYARRSVELSAQVAGSNGQGVSVDGVVRQVNQYVLNDRRGAQAAAAESETRAAFLSRLETILGTPGEAGSLSSRIDGLESALIAATARPDSSAALTAAVDAARSLALGLNEASAALQNERLAADRQIGVAVDQLNTALSQVETLNSRIVAVTTSGGDPSALMDQRAQIIDGIATLVPLREVAQENGRIGLVTTGGAVLLDGTAAVFGFTPVQAIEPEMTRASGGLSGLTLNGKPMETTGPAALLGQGALSALFAVRDDLAVTGQAGLDALARDLVERFSDPGLDLSLAPGDPGLFTDGGSSFATTDEAGLSARIALNTAVDPKAGGSVTRLRDGLAAVSGAEGDASLLTALAERMAKSVPTASAALPAGSRSLASLAADLVSVASVQRLSAETEQTFTIARLTAVSDLEQAGGVDTDAEMQSLLVLEKSYAANARVIQALDEMLTTLLGI